MQVTPALAGLVASFPRFGVATIAAMGTLSSPIGGTAGHLRASGALTQSALLATCAACAIAVGAFRLWSDLA